MLKRLKNGAFGMLGYELRRKVVGVLKRYPNVAAHELDEGFSKIIENFPESLATDSVRLFTTYQAIRYVVENEISGDLIECGVFQGRHIYMMARTLAFLGAEDKEIYLYDTFEGMTKPGPFDAKLSRDLDATSNLERWRNSHRDDYVDYCYAPLERVTQLVLSSGYPEGRFHFVKGDVLETIPNDHHEKIAILRLDTDFFEATKWELEHLYEKIVPGGVLIIDDYGSWAGCRKAVDEFLGGLPFRPFLIRTDKSERVAVKP